MDFLERGDDARYQRTILIISKNLRLKPITIFSNPLFLRDCKIPILSASVIVRLAATSNGHAGGHSSELNCDLAAES